MTDRIFDINGILCSSSVVPVIIADSVVVTAIQGSTATLRCTASGEPVPNQTWTRDGAAVSGSQFLISVDGRVLTLTSVTVEDRGVYTCHASNTAGTDSATVTLDVHCEYSTFCV